MRNIEFMKTMTVSTVQGNGALLELSHKAVSEAQSMKAITIVALIYVPASFVAVIYDHQSLQFKFTVLANNFLLRIFCRWAMFPPRNRMAL